MKVQDIATEKELETIKMHLELSSKISINDIDTFWRDSSNTLCIKYSSGGWWHYSEEGEWW